MRSMMSLKLSQNGNFLFLSFHACAYNTTSSIFLSLVLSCTLAMTMTKLIESHCSWIILGSSRYLFCLWCETLRKQFNSHTTRKCVIQIYSKIITVNVREISIKVNWINSEKNFHWNELVGDESKSSSTKVVKSDNYGVIYTDWSSLLTASVL